MTDIQSTAHDDHPSKPSSNGQSRVSIVLLTGFVAILVLERMHTYFEPIERDIAGYAVIAHEMLLGRLLYSDLWERKPPLLYGVFAVAQMLAGYGRAEIFLLNIVAATATMLGLYVAGCRVRSANAVRSTGFIAAGLWVLVGGDLYIQANQPNTEVFVNACLVWALAILFQLSAEDAGSNVWAESVCVGALLACATLFKHHTVLACAAYLSGFVICPSSTGQGLRARIRIAAVATGVVILAWSGVIAWFAVTHRFDVFVDVLFRQNLDYAGAFWQSIFDLPQAFAGEGRFLRWAYPPVALIVIWSVLRFFRGGQWRASAPAVMLLFGAIGIWLVISIPGHFFPHYYQLALPVICLATAFAASGLKDLILSRVVSRGLVGGMFVVCIIRQGHFYLLPADEWSRLKDVGNFVEQQRLADHLNSVLLPTDRFWNFGQDPSLYFATKKSPPTGLLYLDPLKAGPSMPTYWARLMHDLTTQNPQLIVMSRSQYWSVPPDAPVFPWLREYYRPMPVLPQFPGYVLFTRNGSALQGRLLQSDQPKAH